MCFDLFLARLSFALCVLSTADPCVEATCPGNLVCDSSSGSARCICGPNLVRLNETFCIRTFSSCPKGQGLEQELNPYGCTMDKAPFGALAIQHQQCCSIPNLNALLTHYVQERVMASATSACQPNTSASVPSCSSAAPACLNVTCPDVATCRIAASFAPYCACPNGTALINNKCTSGMPQCRLVIWKEMALFLIELLT